MECTKEKEKKMKNKQILIMISILVLLVMPMICAPEIEITNGGDSVSTIVELEVPDIPVNYTEVNTNSSEYWKTNLGDLDDVNATQMDNNNGVLTFDMSWLINLLDSLYCRLTGCTMTGDLKLNDGVNISDTGESVKTPLLLGFLP